MPCISNCELPFLVNGTNHKNRVSTREITIPRRAVRELIGHQGEHIKRLSRDTKCRLNFADDNDRNSSAPRRMVIRGAPGDVAAAEMAIRDFITALPVVERDIVVVREGEVGRLIGKGGAVIRRLQDTSGAKIEMNPKVIAVGGFRDVNLSGTAVQVQRAKEHIKEILAVNDWPVRSATRHDF